jgi:hypothetical protein
MAVRRPIVGLVAFAASVFAACSGSHGTESIAPTVSAVAEKHVQSTTVAATLLVRPDLPGPSIQDHLLGANMAMWYDITQSGIAPSFTQAKMTAVRWPGGSASDQYHWQNHTLCAGGYADPHSTFDNFMTSVARPANLDVAITLDYGSNAACNGGGDPAEAAAWVDYANNLKGYGIVRWTVGNENYGSWEYDLHAAPNDAATYAQAVATGYYPKIKAKDPAARVGVVVLPGWSPAWDPTVLASAQYDFVELHWYAQAPGQENDTFLLTQAPQQLTSLVRSLQGELSTAGHGSTPIYLGELGSVYANPGKQATSITQALFAGEVLGELLNDGVARATWWLGYGGCNDASSGNFNPSLYGWQNFGGYQIFSDGTPEYGCSNATTVPRGTLLPTARAYELIAGVANAGEHMDGTVLGGTSSSLRAYAMSRGTGYGIVLFNLDQANSASVAVSIGGLAVPASATTSTYGKAEYDLSQTNVWAGPSTSQTSVLQGRFTAVLPPWSMNAITIDRRRFRHPL